MAQVVASFLDRFGPSLLAAMLAGGIAWGTQQAHLAGMERRLSLVERYVDEDRSSGATLSRELGELRVELRTELRAIRELIGRRASLDQ